MDYSRHSGTDAGSYGAQYYYSPAPQSYDSGAWSGGKEAALEVVPVDGERSSRICGLRRKIFWIILAVVVVVVIIAAVGGGVGAVFANKGGDKEGINEPQTSSDSSPGSTSPVTEPPTKTTPPPISSVSVPISSSISGVPSGSPPPGCTGNATGQYFLNQIDAATGDETRITEGDDGDILRFTLENYQVTNTRGQTMVVWDGGQVGFEESIGADNVRFWAGWTLCENSSLSFAQDTEFWNCDSNIYTHEPSGADCTLAYLEMNLDD